MAFPYGPKHSMVVEKEWESVEKPKEQEEVDEEVREEVEEWVDYDEEFLEHIKRNPYSTARALFDVDKKAAYDFWQEMKPLEKDIENLDKLTQDKRSKHLRLYDERKKADPTTEPDMSREQKEIVSLDAELKEKKFGKIRTLRGQQGDFLFEKEIEEVRENSDHWADQFVRERKRIIRDHQKDLVKWKWAKENGKDYFEPEESTSLRLRKLDTKMQLAKGKHGMTPDHLGEFSDDYQGMWESGHKYFENMDNLRDNLENMSYEEAMEILEEGHLAGKYSDNNYYSMKRIIRQHYKV